MLLLWLISFGGLGQVAVWRCEERRVLVLAFRGTEMAKWKDIVTDAKMMPAGFTQERVGGSDAPSVHAGFLEVRVSSRPYREHPHSHTQCVRVCVCVCVSVCETSRKAHPRARSFGLPACKRRVYVCV